MSNIFASLFADDATAAAMNDTSNFQRPDYQAMEVEAFGAGDDALTGGYGVAGLDKRTPGAPSADPNAWVGRVLGPAMKQIMGTAMRPKPRAPMGGGGHGVNASGGTAAKVPDTIMKMATLDEPLANIHQFAGLFD